jgi:hypothetical protein
MARLVGGMTGAMFAQFGTEGKTAQPTSLPPPTGMIQPAVAIKFTIAAITA